MLAYAVRRLQGTYRDQPIIFNPDVDDNAPTCVAHYAKDVSTHCAGVDGQMDRTADTSVFSIIKQP